jgi:predicted transposase YdaD
MIFGEYDREMDIAVNRREAREEGREEGREEAHEEDRLYFLELLNQGLTIEEIKERLQ